MNVDLSMYSDFNRSMNCTDVCHTAFGISVQADPNPPLPRVPNCTQSYIDHSR